MRTVLITGASRGIGLGLVRGFLGTSGTRVIATARTPESALELAALIKASGRYRTGIQCNQPENMYLLPQNGFLRLKKPPNRDMLTAVR